MYNNNVETYICLLKFEEKTMIQCVVSVLQLSLYKMLDGTVD